VREGLIHSYRAHGPQDPAGGLGFAPSSGVDPPGHRIYCSGAFDGSDPMMRGCSLTTVGYGDIIPVRPLAQMGSLLLSVAGPLYIAVVMGVLISRLTTSGERRDQD
jgi:hypothetical protein